MTTNQLIESFINGNISENLPKLKKKGFEVLMDSYREVTGSSIEKANMFVLYVMGAATFQSYCDTE